MCVCEHVCVRMCACMIKLVFMFGNSLFRNNSVLRTSRYTYKMINEKRRAVWPHRANNIAQVNHIKHNQQCYDFYTYIYKNDTHMELLCRYMHLLLLFCVTSKELYCVGFLEGSVMVKIQICLKTQPWCNWSQSPVKMYQNTLRWNSQEQQKYSFYREYKKNKTRMVERN